MPLRDVPVLIPRTYFVANGYDGRPRRINFTPEQAIESAKNVNRQIKAGLRIPVCLMHDPDAEPEYLELKKNGKDPDYLSQWMLAKGYIGDVKQAVVKDGKTYAIVDIPDPDDIKLFDKIGTVSPSLVSDWTDERGKTWNGLNILHIGVTPKPVQRDLPRATAYPEKSKNQAIWFSISIPTGSYAMDQEDKDTTPESGLSDFIKRIVDAAKELGIHIKGDPKTVNEVAIAFESAVATKTGDMSDMDEPVEMGEDMEEMDEELDPGEMPDDNETETEPVMPAFMSHWIPKIAEDTRKSDIVDLLKNGKITGDTAKMLRSKLDSDITNLSQNLTSYFDTKTGNIKPLEVDQLIAAYKLLPNGRFSKGKDNLSHTMAVKPPAATPSAEDRESAAAEELVAFIKK